MLVREEVERERESSREREGERGGEGDRVLHGRVVLSTYFALCEHGHSSQLLQCLGNQFEVVLLILCKTRRGGGAGWS